MSTDDWDPIGTVVGSVLGGAIAAPLTPILGPLAPVLGGIVGGSTLGHGDAPQAPPPHPPAPTPGGGPLPPPPPAPGPLPPPPTGPAPGSGEAADKDNADAGTVADVITQLHELDKSAAATIDAIHAAGTAGQQQLDNIGKDVNDKITELGPRLDTPAGQQELRDFLKEKLTAAKKVLDQQIADADAKARHTRELTEKYGGIGGDDSGKGGTEPAGNGGGGSAGGGESGGGGASPADQGTAPAAAPAAAAPPAAPTSPFGQGMMPGAGMMPAGMGIPQMPSFGGGGMPGLGGGDPLSALSGLGGGQGGGHEPGLRDDQNSGDDPKSGSSDPKFHDDPAMSGTENGKSGTDGAPTTPAAADSPSTAAGEAAGNHTPADPAAAPAPPATTHVALPNGESAEARTVQGATAVKAAVGGATVADAWHQAGVNVPPPGTPVTDPIPPTKLQAGDVGVWQDHLVMALGNGKVLVSGQVQPLSSVGSSPDFLGWMDPSAQAAKAVQPVPPTPPTPPTPPQSS
jgi:hypothetical protein